MRRSRNSRVDAVTAHVADNGWIATGQAAEAGDEVRVRQAADVEHQIGVNRHAVLEAKAHEIDHHLGLRCAAARHPHEDVPQFVDREVRRVQDQIGHRADGVELAPLFRDALAHRTIGRQRMRATGLAEPSNQRRVARLEKNQGRRHGAGPQLPIDTRKLRQKSPLAHVDDDRDLVGTGIVTHG